MLPLQSCKFPRTQSGGQFYGGFIDAVIEGRRRKAAQQLAIFLEHHKHSLRDDVKIELQRRLLDACKPDLSIGCNRKEAHESSRGPLGCSDKEHIGN